MNQAVALITTLAVFCVLLVGLVVYLVHMLVKSYHIYNKTHLMLRTQRHKISAQQDDIMLRDNALKALLMIFIELLYGDPAERERRSSLLRSDLSLLEIKANADRDLTPKDICELMILAEDDDMDRTLDIMHSFFERHLSMDADLREHMSDDDRLAFKELVEIIDVAKKSRDELRTSVEFDRVLINDLMALSEPTPEEIA